MRWLFALGVVVALVAGFVPVGYFAQATYGQLTLLSNAKPIDEYLADPEVDTGLKKKLRKVKQIRQFAVRELGLPDNDSYKNYVRIGRPYVVWNVIATPELSMQPLEWCFPVAGCVSYRGYYNKEDALDFAGSLQRQGYDVHVEEVSAYSTLGWFNDPVMSTFINYSETQLAQLIFHELAHQLLYKPGDSEFNESFAVAVEEEGVERWLAKHGNAGMRLKYLNYKHRKQDFLALLSKYQERLTRLFESDAPAIEKRARKAGVFLALKDEFKGLKVSWGGDGGYDAWFAQPLTNAHLASVSTYYNSVPGFRALMSRQPTLSAFYMKASNLADLPVNARHAQLSQLGKDDVRSTPLTVEKATPVTVPVKPPAVG